MTLRVHHVAYLFLFSKIVEIQTFYKSVKKKFSVTKSTIISKIKVSLL